MVRIKGYTRPFSRKRTNEESQPLSNEPKRRRMVHEKKDNYEEELLKKDKFCWTCHSDELKDDMWHFWPCCPRIYHLDCLTDHGSSEAETTCPECQLESVDGTILQKPVPLGKLNNLLLSVSQKYLDDKRKKSNDKKKDNKFKLHPVFVKWPANAVDDLIKVVDFNYLINKIHSDAYSKTSEFFSDVKWILHNCYLFYGSQSPVTKDAGKLVNLIKADLLDIEACHECCYPGSRNPDFFVKLCNPPHEIIWSQISGYPYWAAKCLKVNQETVYVKFFGTHQIGKLSVGKCYYISRNHPNHPQVPKTKSYKDSVAELKEYIRLYNLQRREPFKYYVDKIAFKPENSGKENQEVHMNLMSETTSVQDDLRLGADFSNLNHSAHSYDQASSPDRPVIADTTQTTASSESSSSPYNNESPIYYEDIEPQVGEVSTSIENMDDGSDLTVSSQMEHVDIINRFFSNGNRQINLSLQDFKEMKKGTENFMISLHKLSLKLAEENSLHMINQENERFRKLLIESDAEKKELTDKLNYSESKRTELLDKLQNTTMILANNKNEKEVLQEKLKKLEAENAELKEVLEGDPYIEAKRKLYCYVCVKPAEIFCCLNACYCSEQCRIIDLEGHNKHICVKPASIKEAQSNNEGRPTTTNNFVKETTMVIQQVTTSTVSKS